MHQQIRQGSMWVAMVEVMARQVQFEKSGESNHSGVREGEKSDKSMEATGY